MAKIQHIFSALVLVLVSAVLFAAPLHAEEKGAKGGVGYGGAYVQLKPIMAPVRGTDGQIRCEVMTLRVILDVGERERPGCFSVPLVHERILMYLNTAGLTAADLAGKRLELLSKKLLEIAIATTAKGYYSEVQIVDQAQLQLEMKLAADNKKPKAASDPKEQYENKSKTLTSQCQ